MGPALRHSSIRNEPPRNPPSRDATDVNSGQRYVLISPCRNAADFMRQTLDSVVAQSLPPAKWVIVDDGSTDDTPKILAEYAARHEWIQIVTRSDQGHRAVGPGVVDAFYSGYGAINVEDFGYVCKLDLGLRLPPRYFETLIERMLARPSIGTCSGKSYLEQGGKLVSERHGDENSLGMTKFYRVACFTAIGGFVREVGWDGIDGHMCGMKGWDALSWDAPELCFTHLRPMGASYKGIFTGRVRQGFGQYYMATRLLYLTASAIFRVNRKPNVFGELAVLWGWLDGALQRRPRYDNEECRAFLRRFQMWLLPVGRRRSIEELGFGREAS